jgi:glycosyltransferase involved in cell wall biosynthesis
MWKLFMNKTALIIGHYSQGRGTIDMLRTYVQKRGYATSVLLHPLDDYSKLPSELMISNKLTYYTRRPRGFLNRFEDFWLSVRLIRRTVPDVVVGTTNFDIVPAIFCRIFMRTTLRSIIYYPRDFSDARFANPLLNQIYQWVERVAVANADKTISNTFRAESRRIQLGLSPDRSVVIPNPVNISKPEFKNKHIRKDHFIFVGHVSAEHGLLELVKVISPIITKLVIIGEGPDLKRIVSFAKGQGIEVESLHRKSQSFTVKYLRDFEGIGLAPYLSTERWTYYCSPLKVGEYVSCCLPVLMSCVPEVSNEIEKKSLGVTYESLDVDVIREKLDQLNVHNFEERAHEFYLQRNVANSLARLPL